MNNYIDLYQLEGMFNFPIGTVSYLLKNKQSLVETRIIKIKGKKRTLHIPIKTYKEFLKKLKKKLDDIKLNQDTKRVVHGYTKGHSILSNAEVHCNSFWIIEIDIKSFFDSITKDMIRKTLENRTLGRQRLSPQVLEILSELTTFNNSLPLGFSTSPHLSNLVFEPIDKKILTRIKQLSNTYAPLQYTRYADNLFISTKRKTPYKDVKSIGKQITQIIESHGFRINPTRSKVMRKGAAMIVCGLNVDATEPSLPRWKKNQYRSHFYHCIKVCFYYRRRRGELDISHHFDRYKGLLSYIANVDKQLYRSIQRMFKKKNAWSCFKLLRGKR